MKLLTKAEILAADDLKSEVIPVPEWGGDVRISVMSGAARDAYESSIISVNDKGESSRNLDNIRAKMVGATIVDDQGERLFSDKEIAQLGKKSSRALDRCFEVAQRLNAVTDDDLEELAKN